MDRREQRKDRGISHPRRYRIRHSIERPSQSFRSKAPAPAAQGANEFSIGVSRPGIEERGASAGEEPSVMRESVASRTIEVQDTDRLAVPGRSDPAALNAHLHLLAPGLDVEEGIK